MSKWPVIPYASSLSKSDVLGATKMNRVLLHIHCSPGFKVYPLIGEVITGAKSCTRKSA